MIQKLAKLKVNDSFDMPVLINQMDLRVAKNGKKFLALVFSDNSGELPGKYWDASDEDAENYKAGTIVELSGKCELYNGSLQVKIVSMTPTEPGTFSIDQFTQHGPMTKKEMIDRVNDLLFAITEPNWNRIVRFLLNRHKDTFFEYPAAKSNHHDFTGGLAFHTISIANLATDVCKRYPQVNKPLLLAGAILHDLGKTTELSGPVGTEYTVEGNLLGHIVIIDEEIIEACDKLKLNPQQEDIILLRHMIISHHGLTEYGSPERPQLLEAEILHDLDELDASINMITKAEKKASAGQFTDRIFGLDNRRFYVPNQKE